MNREIERRRTFAIIADKRLVPGKTEGGPRGEVIVWAVIHFIEGISVLYPEFKVGIVLSTEQVIVIGQITSPSVSSVRRVTVSIRCEISAIVL